MDTVRLSSVLSNTVLHRVRGTTGVVSQRNFFFKGRLISTFLYLFYSKALHSIPMYSLRQSLHSLMSLACFLDTKADFGFFKHSQASVSGLATLLLQHPYFLRQTFLICSSPYSLHLHYFSSHWLILLLSSTRKYTMKSNYFMYC